MIRHKQFAYILLTLLFISLFGPYVAGPIRMEHVVLYSLLPVLLYLIPSIRLNTSTKIFFIFLLTLFSWTLLSSLIQNINPLSYINEVENTFQPFAVFLFVLILISKMDSESIRELYIYSLKLIVVLFSIHSLLIVYTIVTFDISFLSPFHSSVVDEVRGTVATRALANFRFSGIFNQPMESGVGYSIAIYSWYYCSDHFKSNLLKYTFLALLIIGGIASVSKIFIFFILFLFMVLIFKQVIKIIESYSINKKYIIGSIASLTMLPIIFSIVLLIEWEGLDRLLRVLSFLQADDFATMVSMATGGRFTGGGEEGAIIVLFKGLLYNSPILGNGFAKISIVDNAFLEMMAYGGLILVSIYVLFILFLVYKSIVISKTKISIELRYFYLLFIILIAGFGAPVFTMNRVSILLIAVLAFLFHLQKK